MSLHILKMAVGVDSVPMLREIQNRRLENAGRGGDLRHLTRNYPRRAEKIIDGGSIFWIIKGYVRARQRILRIDHAVNSEGRRRCAFILDPELFETDLKPQRPLQGWRYLEPTDAPADRRENDLAEDGLPPEMAAELRQLGLL